MSDHCHLASNARPTLLGWQIPHLDGVVGRATHQSIALEVKAAHGARVTDERLHGPWVVGPNVPQLHHQPRITHTLIIEMQRSNNIVHTETINLLQNELENVGPRRHTVPPST